MVPSSRSVMVEQTLAPMLSGAGAPLGLLDLVEGVVVAPELGLGSLGEAALGAGDGRTHGGRERRARG